MKSTSFAALLICVFASFTSCVANSETTVTAAAAQSEESEGISALSTEQTVAQSVEAGKTDDRIFYDWVDADGDGEEEYVQFVDLPKFSLDEIMRDDDLTQLYIGELDRGEIDPPPIEEILKYSVLSEWFINHVEAADYSEWYDTPNSTCFSEVFYTPVFCYLDVIFRDSGAEYRYYNVPDYVFEEFINADSLGRYYNEYIKGQYECERMEYMIP